MAIPVAERVRKVRERKKAEGAVQFCLAIDPETRARLKEQAAKKGITQSELVKELIKRADFIWANS